MEQVNNDDKRGSWLREKGRSLLNAIGTRSIRINILQALPFWLASVFTGLVAVGYTKLFSYAESGLEYALEWRPWIIFIISPVCFVIAYLLVKRFAPFAKGSGIPQVMAAIEMRLPEEGKRTDRLLSMRIIVTKIASSLMVVVGGGAIGREGPTIQIAASIFRIIDKRIPKSWPKLSSQNFILTGAAAGLAAAFNTPLGGIVFAMEELAKIHIRFFRTALFTAVIIAGLTAQGLLGPYLYLGYPEVGRPGVLIFFAVILVAIVTGIAASFMCRMILKIRKWKRSFNISRNLLFIIFVGLIIASAAFFFNPYILGSGKNLINHLLFTSDKKMELDTVFFRMLGPSLCFNTGAAGGVFAPALAAGASIGAYISALFHYAGANANILILSGMVGFLTGVTRTPFTSAILVLEMTDRHGVIFHLMLAAMIANLAALIIEKRSFYDQLKKEYLSEVAK